jgi:hypothetical protein
MRQFGDLDILVAQVDIGESLSVLEIQGYRVLDDPRKEISEKRKAALFKWMHHYGLINKNSGIHVELHWLLSPNLYGMNAHEASILEKAETVNLQGKEVLCLCNEDLFIFLCQHGARHVWKRLSWLCEVARLAQDSDNNWSSILGLACRTENERILVLALLLANGFMDVRLPKEIYESQSKSIDESLIRFSQLLMESISLDEDNRAESDQILANTIIYKNVFRSPLERITFYLRLATMPMKCDFAILSLPDALFPVYNLVRPLRLMNEYKNALRTLWGNEGINKK